MKHFTNLKRRTQFILFFYISVLMLFSTLCALGELHVSPLYPMMSIVATISLIVLFLLNIPDKLMASLLVLSITTTSIIVNITMENIYYMMFFIVSLFLISLYGSSLLNTIFISVTVIEVVGIFIYKYRSLLENVNSSDFILFNILFAFLTVIAIMNATYITYTMKRVEKKTEQMEMSFHSKEGYLRLFFENAKDSIAVFDLEGRLITGNPAFENLYGWNIQENIGKKLPLIPPENLKNAKKRTTRTTNGESFDSIETRDMRKDGTYFDAHLTLSPIYDKDGKVIATSLISRDISYRKEAEKLHLQSEKLKLTGEIAAGVAHEIRNPLTVISGFTQLISSDKDSPYGYYMQVIEKEIKRINLIISEFLVLSKPHAIQTKDFYVEDILNETLELFLPQAELKQIQICSSFVQPHSLLHGNENQIKQVFINIFKNAFEAMEKSNDNKIFSIDVKRTNTNAVSITFSDTGIGMNEETLQQIFTPFYTTKNEGTGLGMLITQKIIQEHNGKINIHSDYGIGTEIEILLPLKIQLPANAHLKKEKHVEKIDL